MDYRHEWKHPVGYAELPALRARLRAVLPYDAHAVQGQYKVRSLYFDDLHDTALREKLDGVCSREKFRLRCYNGDESYLLLEKKCKRGALGWKEQTTLTARQVRALLCGDREALSDCGDPLLQELLRRMAEQGLRPKTLVDYTREPFVFAPGNVRVTLDHSIRTGLCCTDFLNPDCPTIPAGDADVILEVKWDAFLPAVIRDIVQVPNAHSAAFSKYAVCRRYD